MQPTSKPEDFVPRRPFPGESTERLPAPRSGWLSRYVLPIVLFVVIVGVIAWVVQNMPKWTTPYKPPTPTPDGVAAAGSPVLEFPRGEKAVWEKDSDYVKDWERGVPGFYDFPFRNPGTEEVELGLLQPSCDCVSIKFALLPHDAWAKAESALAADPGTPVVYAPEPSWLDLEPSKEKGVTVLPGGQGVIRVGWNGRKDPGRQLNLTPKFWTQPKGKPGLRYDKVTLTVPIMMAPLVHYHPAKQGVGTLGSGQKQSAKFYLYSVTRGPDELTVKLQDGPPDPLLEVHLEPVPPADWPDLISFLVQEGLSKPRLRSAYIATATVYEKKDGNQMDLGPFTRHFKVQVGEFPQDTLQFQMYGVVRSAVEVGGGDEPGKLKLRPFSVRQGTREVVPLWTDSKIDLELHEQTPPGLVVKLQKLDKESVGARAKWRLEVVVPPNTVAPGTFAEDSAVVLRIRNSNPPRLVRIPIVGHADAD